MEGQRNYAYRPFNFEFFYLIEVKSFFYGLYQLFKFFIHAKITVPQLTPAPLLFLFSQVGIKNQCLKFPNPIIFNFKFSTKLTYAFLLKDQA